MTAQSLETAAPSRPQLFVGRRLALAALALAVTGLALALLGWLIGTSGAPPPPVRAPFGMGLREAAPSPSGLGAMILGLQSQFYRGLQAAVAALRDGGALSPLLGIGFAYGIFHAAGPGHGKAVISAYLVASERTLAKGFALSLAAALVQALVAVVLVVTLTVALKATAATMSRVTNGVELASFAFVAAFGALLTWRKAGKLAGILARARDPGALVAAEACDHVHLPPPQELDRLTRWRDLAAVVLAAGMRPCAGAIIVLVFALSQGLFAAGIAATFAMALGTALTTGLIATLAVFAKSLALRLAGGRGERGAIAIAGLELLAATTVLALGAVLLTGLWASGGGS